jgi:TRAP-type C4-dicarboxylate transport system substrate-binding protein
MRAAVQKEEANLVKQLEEKGMKVTKPNVADFKAKMQPAYDKIGAYAGKENVDAFIKMADSTK